MLTIKVSLLESVEVEVEGGVLDKLGSPHVLDEEFEGDEVLLVLFNPLFEPVLLLDKVGEVDVPEGGRLVYVLLIAAEDD